MLEKYIKAAAGAEGARWCGEVTNAVGLLIESKGPAAGVGEFCEIATRDGRRVRTQVVGFREGALLSMALDEVGGIQSGDAIVSRGKDARVPVGKALLGRVLDGFGRPMDGRGGIEAEGTYDLYAPPPGALEREPIDQPLETGIRVIDSFLTCGRGQRLGIFGGSGVGKSTLLGSMVRNNDADVSVIALIGERNREVRDFLERDLGEEGRARSVTVVATSDRPSPLRVRACFVALAVAEYFRDQGKSVLLVMDSVTRLAMAQREIGLASGEPPSQKGYTPSVFQMLPRIFERAGNFARGSITGFFTVLVEGDDMNEPIADAVRGILDGHIVLSRELGQAGHYPAVDVLQSVSRLASRLAKDGHNDRANRVRETLALLRSSEDLIRLGAYAAGTNARLDEALGMKEQLNAFLRQHPEERSRMDATREALERLAGMGIVK